MIGVHYYFLALCALFLIGRLTYRLFLSPLSKIPGPPLAAVSRFWRLKEAYCGHVEKTELELHRKFGK
jgi:hypothetical protein